MIVGSLPAICPSLALGGTPPKLLAHLVPIRLGQRRRRTTPDRLQQLLADLSAVLLAFLQTPDDRPHVLADVAEAAFGGLLMDEGLHRLGHSDLYRGHWTIPPPCTGIPPEQAAPVGWKSL